ncbi:endonuclease/exonuclease/phosphatase family protein [Adhaeretor mobilis]|uniref:Endonuclease/exonuclease/phosphatase domain-containing protein n=1 Tax=Adhaeretor mobilis TaxID=1930276 RepID=A0A517N2H7_9BACT|nr:endonuclease/exonuclease/phosphatase family protein [Adhaeretor mobilis]QDT01337.1 hypothetical protein HG15A2_46790 [Adhaeretor mobilis]
MSAPERISADDSGMPLRLMTYNIHKGIGGLDRKYRLERIVEVIDHYRPDVACLQEVDEGVPRSHRDHQVEKLAEQLGYQHTAFQRNVKLRRGAYGNAILSRFPIQECIDIDLTVRPKKRRQAQLARLIAETPHGSANLTVVNLHLGLAGFERTIQLRRLFASGELSKPPSDHVLDQAIIVAGDFNDVWENLGKRLLQPQGFQRAGAGIRTFPAIAPLRALDGIHFRGRPLSYGHSFAGRTNIAKQASDHRPLVADFELKLQ